MHELNTQFAIAYRLFHSLQKSPIPARLQQEILLELRTVDRLRETLDIVDIVLGFLSSGGANSGKPLGVYIKNTLKMRRPFCEKVNYFIASGVYV